MSDHNPQDVEGKRLPFAEATHGAIGIETMLTAGLRLVHSGDVADHDPDPGDVERAGGNPRPRGRDACGPAARPT